MKGIKIGQTYRLKEDRSNPFLKECCVLVKDYKDGWVLYDFASGEGVLPSSRPVDTFLSLYEEKGEVQNRL